MNILHHKSWHVRNKDNIARVRRDEAKAAEEAKKKEEQVTRAERESRINFLRSRHNHNETATANVTATSTTNLLTDEQQSINIGESDGHLNLFTINYTQSKANKEHEIEKKDEKEKYEKQIGYLTYLGQYQNEDPNLKRWYNIEPKRYDPSAKFKEDDVKDAEKKRNYDPMKVFVNAPKNYKLEKEEDEASKLQNNKIKEVVKKKSKLKKHKKEKKNKKEKKKSKDKKKLKDKYRDTEKKRLLKEKKIKELRDERLKREATARLRQAELLKKYNKS